MDTIKVFIFRVCASRCLGLGADFIAPPPRAGGSPPRGIRLIRARGRNPQAGGELGARAVEGAAERIAFNCVGSGRGARRQKQQVGRPGRGELFQRGIFEVSRSLL